MLTDSHAEKWPTMTTDPTTSTSSNRSLVEWPFLPDIPTLEPTIVLLQFGLQCIDMYLLPILILVGTLGNTLSFVVFVSTHLRRHRCNVYLASLALVDNAFLLCVFISWTDKFGVNVYHREGACQLLVYLTQVANFLSVWYVVAFTVERYVVLRLPFQHRKLNSNTRSAKIIVVALALLALAAYSFSVFTSGVTEFFDMQPLCSPLPDYSMVLSVLNNVDTLLVLVVPTIVVIACNVRIAYIVWTFYRSHKSSMTPTQAFMSQRRWDFSRRPEMIRSCAGDYSIDAYPAHECGLMRQQGDGIKYPSGGGARSPTDVGMHQVGGGGPTDSSGSAAGRSGESRNGAVRAECRLITSKHCMAGNCRACTRGAGCSLGGHGGIGNGGGRYTGWCDGDGNEANGVIPMTALSTNKVL